MKKYDKIFISILIGTLISLLFSLPEAKAQWKEQTIRLRPGWNAVYLEVEPHPNRCEELFKDIPVASIWTWNSNTSLVRYIKNPDTLAPNHPQWLVYFPPDSSNSFLSNLFRVLGRRAYLIKLEGEQTVNWTVTGKPCLPKINWKSNSFNLVGFHLAPGEEPFFEPFFTPSPAHAGQDIYRLNKEDKWEKVTYPAAIRMRHGEAYWVYCIGHSDYIGPMVCKVEQGRGIDFGNTLIEQEFFVRNLVNSEVEISLRAMGSKNPVDETQPRIAGDVPLLYWKFDPLQELIGWFPLPNTLSIPIQAKQKEHIRLAVKLSAMAPTGLSQSLLEVTNGQGMRVFVPVSASGRAVGHPALARKRNGNSGFVLDSSQHAGLWVGTAVINRVSKPVKCCEPIESEKCSSPDIDCCPLIEPFSAKDPDCCPEEAGGQICDMNEDFWTTPTASKFQFRLIIHYGKKVEVDNNGNQVSIEKDANVRLLREVIQMWEGGTYELIYDPVYPEEYVGEEKEPVQVVKDPGNYVLLSDDSLISLYNGSTMQSGKSLGRRISSAAFGFQKVTDEPDTHETRNGTNVIVKRKKVCEDPKQMNNETSAEGNTILSCSIKISSDDPLNPYRHKYHPDHDNLASGQERKPIIEQDKIETYEVTRDIKLEFTSNDPELPDNVDESAEAPGWGVTEIGGIYWERISELHKNKIFVKGFFRLHKVSQIDTLIFPL